MKVEEFNPIHHYIQMCSWYYAHNIQPMSIEFYPAKGFIIENIAAGFLYQTDSNVVFAENFITNPLESPEKRFNALELISKYILEYVESIKPKKIIVSSKERSMIERAKRLEFKEIDNYTILHKNVG